jgi:hypothetical protein
MVKEPLLETVPDQYRFDCLVRVNEYPEGISRDCEE